MYTASLCGLSGGSSVIDRQRTIEPEPYSTIRHSLNHHSPNAPNSMNCRCPNAQKRVDPPCSSLEQDGKRNASLRAAYPTQSPQPSVPDETADRYSTDDQHRWKFRLAGICGRSWIAQIEPRFISDHLAIRFQMLTVQIGEQCVLLA